MGNELTRIQETIELNRRVQEVRDKGFCVETGKWDNKEKMGPFARIFNNKGLYLEVHSYLPTPEKCLFRAVAIWKDRYENQL